MMLEEEAFLQNPNDDAVLANLARNKAKALFFRIFAAKDACGFQKKAKKLQHCINIGVS